MKPKKDQFPEGLFKEPDLGLLLKYFPESDFQWPKNPNYQNFLENKPNEAPEWIISVGIDSDLRKAFWQALRQPEGSYLAEGKRQPEEIARQEELIGSRGLKPIELDGTYHLIYADEKRGLENGMNLEIKLSPEKDFSAELFAIHSLLKYQLKTRINPLRRFPVLSLQQIQQWHKRPDYKIHKNEFNDWIERQLQNYIDYKQKGIEKGFDNTTEKTDLQWLDKAFRPLNFISEEHHIRKDLCRGIRRFLEQEKVCINREGKNLLGAFLVFSSGLSFRKLDRKIWQEFDPELKHNFNQCTKL